MIDAVIILLALLLIFSAIAFGLTLMIRRFVKTDDTAKLLGGLAAPLALVVAGALAPFLDTDVEAPAPGNVILGALMIATILTPFCFLASGFALKRLRRRQRQNV